MGKNPSSAWPDLTRKRCSRCSAQFDCGGPRCWCAEEDFRVPVPAAADGDCLCPTCLRALAAARA